MSQKMFERMTNPLPELLKELETGERQELDPEFERVTRRDCDEAARSMSDEEFMRAVQEALRNLRRRRSRQQKEIPAVA